MKKVVIIGAGPAGLSAAYKLLKSNKNYDITVLEASDRIGGISTTLNYKGNRMDIGGHRFFSKDDSVVNFWNEILPNQGAPSKDDKLLNREVPLSSNGPDPDKEEEVMLTRTRVSRILFLRKFFDYPISLSLSTFKNMGFKNTMKAGFSYLYSALIKRKENNLEDFMINRFGKVLYHMFFEDYTAKVWGRHPRDISPDWGEQRIKGLSLWKAVWAVISKPFKKLFHVKKVETSLIEQFSYPKYGPGQLYETLANKVSKMGAKILFNKEVNKINIKDKRIESISCKDGSTYSGDEFISSMPIKDLYVSMESDCLNQEAFDIASNLLYRDFITVGILVPKLKLTNKSKYKSVNNIVPDCWIYVQEKDVKVGRLQIFNNWSPYMVNDYKDSIFIGLEYFVNEGDEMWNMDEKEFIKFAISELVKINVIDEQDVLDSCAFKVKKAYPAYFGSYAKFDVVKEDLKSISNLYCVGRNGQHRYNNMDHSIASSFIAVSLINEEEIYTIEDLWNVNTEKNYHESK